MELALLRRLLFLFCFSRFFLDQLEGIERLNRLFENFMALSLEETASNPYSRKVPEYPRAFSQGNRADSITEALDFDHSLQQVSVQFSHPGWIPLLLSGPRW